MDSIKDLSISELKSILKSIREYIDLRKKLWKRGAKYFKKNLLWGHDYIVEYYPSLSKEFVLWEASKVYAEVFHEKPSQEEIFLIEKKSLWGGIKVYREDELVDMSFSNVEKKLKK